MAASRRPRPYAEFPRGKTRDGRPGGSSSRDPAGAGGSGPPTISRDAAKTRSLARPPGGGRRVSPRTPAIGGGFIADPATSPTRSSHAKTPRQSTLSDDPSCRRTLSLRFCDAPPLAPSGAAPWANWSRSSAAASKRAEPPACTRIFANIRTCRRQLVRKFIFSTMKRWTGRPPNIPPLNPFFHSMTETEGALRSRRSTESGRRPWRASARTILPRS